MNEHKNIITIEDEIKEFSDKPVKSSALYKKAKELESNAVPDASEASVGDVLTKGENGIGWETPSGGLPNIQSTDAGKVLTVKSGGTGAEWATPTGGVLMIYCDGAAVIQSGRVLIPTNCTLQDISTCFDQEKQIFIKPIFVHLPVVENIQTGEYSYSDNKSAVYLVQSIGKFVGEAIITIGGLSYGVIADPQGGVFVWASGNIT